MENKQIAAVAVVAILIVAAVGVYFVMSGGDSEYRSTNTDCRLQILGNADENDYLDSNDIARTSTPRSPTQTTTESWTRRTSTRSRRSSMPRSTTRVKPRPTRRRSRSTTSPSTRMSNPPPIPLATSSSSTPRGPLRSPSHSVSMTG